MYIKVILFGLILLLSNLSHAGLVRWSGKVKQISVFTNNHTVYSDSSSGLAVIYLDSHQAKVKMCGSDEMYTERVAISTKHPLYNSVLSLALAAKLTGKSVGLWHTNTCTARSTAFDFSNLQLLD